MTQSRKPLIRKAPRLVGLALATLLTAPASGEEVVLDRIVAVVNEAVILSSDLNVEVRSVATQIAQSGGQLPPIDILQRQVLEQLVVKRLQIEIAERAGAQIPDDMLNQTLSGIAQRNGITLNQLPDALAAQGMDYRRYREQLREEMLIEQVRRQLVESEIFVAPEEIDAFLDLNGAQDQNVEYDISHILLGVGATATDAEVSDRHVEAMTIVDQLRQGADFAQLAITNSQGQRAMAGGALGWRRRDQLPASFAQTLDRMQPGQISEPIRSQSGFHILRLEDSRSSGAMIVTQSNVRHILITPNEVRSSDDSRAQLEQVRSQILSEEISFEEAARQYSDDPVSSSRGGSLGWNGPGTFTPAFQAVTDTIEVGRLSEVFQSPFGWHMLEVQERREYDGTEDFRRNQARAAIYQQKLEEATQLWLQQIRDEAYVEIRI